MAVIIFDSGEATRFPTYTNNVYASWQKVANQPSTWEVLQIAVGSHPANGIGVSLLNPYSGSTSFRALCSDVVNNAMRRTLHATQHSEIYLSFMVYFSSLGVATAHDFFAIRDSAFSIVAQLRMNNAGQLLVYAGTTPTLMQTIASGIAAGEWHQIALHIKAGSSSTAVLEVRIDNNTPIDCSGSAMNNAYFVSLGQISVVPGGSLASDQYIDCIQVNDTSGTANNSWPGSPVIPSPSRPDGDTTVTDWVRSSGSNDFDMIKEAAPDLDTTYVSSTVNADSSIYDMSNISNPANTAIRAVCLNIVAKRADVASIIPLVSRGGTTVELAAIPVGADYMSPIEVILEQDPIAESDWTEANFNNTQFGFKHQVD